MKRTTLVISLLLAAMSAVAGNPSRAHAAPVTLSSLSNPTVQTLIGLGSDGVIVGPIRFFDFTFAGFSSTTGARNAGQVAVQPITIDGFGLRFVSPWFAAGGSAVADVITYKLAVTDPSEAVAGINLFSDGTVPLAGLGTFASGSLTARVTGGAIAGRVLSTIDDGHTSPLDTTQPDVAVDFVKFTPQTWLNVTNSVSTASGAGGSGGVATASIVENTFVAVPEPRTAAYAFVPAVMTVMMFTRRTNRRRRIRRVQWHRQYGLGAAVG